MMRRKALSIRQPWTFLILNGLKDIENRTWAVPEAMIGQSIVVHAGKVRDKQPIDWHLEYGLPLGVALVLTSNRLPTGALLGEVAITGCVTESGSPWFSGPYGWLLADPVQRQTGVLRRRRRHSPCRIGY